MKKIVYVVAVIILAGLAYWLYNNSNNSGQFQDYAVTQDGEINSYEDCVAAGYPIMESYPEQCATPDGRFFTRDISGEIGESSKMVSEETGTGEISQGGEINIQFSEDCISSGGTWLSGVSECEYIDETWCTNNGGQFNECGSACRNNPEAEICTLQCVPFCSFR